jgi:hypothetical protein
MANRDEHLLNIPFTNRKDADDFSVSAAREYGAYIWGETQPDGAIIVRDYAGPLASADNRVTAEQAATLEAYKEEWEAGGKGLAPWTGNEPRREF